MADETSGHELDDDFNAGEGPGREEVPLHHLVVQEPVERLPRLRGLQHLLQGEPEGHELS